MSLAAVHFNGVSQAVIHAVEALLEGDEPDHGSSTRRLTLNWKTSQRDAEYAVECLRLILSFAHHQASIELYLRSLDYCVMLDATIDVLAGFLCETTPPCRLQALVLFNLSPRRFHRRLEALHNNRFVKKLYISFLVDNEGASWIADLLRHKTDFTDIHFTHCRFSFLQILPWLRGQPSLESLSFCGCSISNSNGLLLFHDPESTQAFVDNLLLSPSTQLKVLYLASCGASLETKPLMEGFHKNTTVVEVRYAYENAAFRLFIDPILQRNVYLGNVHDLLLGTRMLTLPVAAGVASTIPPPCGLWTTVELVQCLQF